MSKYAKVMIKDVDGIVSIESTPEALAAVMANPIKTDLVHLNGLHNEVITLRSGDIKGFITGDDVDDTCLAELDGLKFQKAQRAQAATAKVPPDTTGVETPQLQSAEPPAVN